MRRASVLVLLILVLITGVVIGQDTLSARVLDWVGGLHLRTAPNTNSNIIDTLEPGAALTIIGRTANNAWFWVTDDSGRLGWVAAAYVNYFGDLAAVPVTNTDDAPASAAPQPPPESAPAPQASGSAGSVAAGFSVNFRAGPSMDAEVITVLRGGTPLTIINTDPSGTWYNALTADGVSGWLAAAYVQTGQPVAPAPEAAPPAEDNALPVAAVPFNFYDYMSPITNRAREIFSYGQTLGNRPNVFSKIGDSITVSPYVMYPIAQGRYNLGPYGYLQGVITYYSIATARWGNSFNNYSLAADVGWSTSHMLDASVRNPDMCMENEIPLECEYRLVKPAVALIMLGTNDMTYLTAAQFDERLRLILQISEDKGVLPVLFTIPTRIGMERQTNEFNRLIRNAANDFGIPYYDYWAVMEHAENHGISWDGVHPSEPPGGVASAVNFNPETLWYGYTLRNITMLHALDVVWRQVMGGG